VVEFGITGCVKVCTILRSRSFTSGA